MPKKRKVTRKPKTTWVGPLPLGELFTDKDAEPLKL